MILCYSRMILKVTEVVTNKTKLHVISDIPQLGEYFYNFYTFRIGNKQMIIS